MESRRSVLIVEDNRADVFLIREAIQSARVEATLHVVSDGDKAIRFFEDADRDAAAPCPALVILDINLPKKTGREVLEWLRGSQRCAKAQVLVVTSSDSQRDRDDMGRLGAGEYFRKPSDYESFLKLGEIVRRLLDPSTDGSPSHNQT